ncbi:hypothetical protein AKJ16_DCAP20620 [Drosera capensis]
MIPHDIHLNIARQASPDISVSISPPPSDPNINGSDLILSPNPSLTALFTPSAPQKRERERERESERSCLPKRISTTQRRSSPTLRIKNLVARKSCSGERNSELENLGSGSYPAGFSGSVSDLRNKFIKIGK